MKVELQGIREKHEQESSANEEVISGLRAKLQQFEETLTGNDVATKIVSSDELKEEKTLEDAQKDEINLKDEAEQLRQRVSAVEAQLAEVLPFQKSSYL